VETRKQAIGPVQVLSDDCLNGHGKKRIDDDGYTYEGQWQNGVEHGKGTCIAANGGISEGDFRQGRMHGNGKEYYGSGTMYEGQWADDERHGMALCIMLMETCMRATGGKGRSMEVSDTHEQQFEVRLKVYQQQKDPAGNVVVVEKGAHGRTIHWVPVLQTGAAPS